MSTLTFKITLSRGYGATKQINVIGTDLVIDYGDGTTTEQSPDTDGINESHNWLNNESLEKTYTVIITGNIIGLGNSFLQYGYNVTEITLPVGLQSIGKNCLTYIDAEEIIIPSTVSSIGHYFLNNSRHIKKIEIQGEQLTTLGYSFMKGCSEVTSIKLPNSLTTLGGDSFDDCSSLKEFEVPPLVTELPDSCFSNVALETLKMNGGPISNPPINENTKIIVPLSKLQEFINHSSYPNERERYDVFGKNLSEKVYVLGVHLAENLQDKNIVASADDGLTTLANKIPETVVIQPNSRKTSFDEIPIDVRIPQIVTLLSDNCFGRSVDGTIWGMLNLRKIELPAQLSSIGKNVFSGCANLEKIKFTNPIPPTVDGTTFQSIPSNCIIEVPYSYIDIFKSTEYFPNPKFYHYKESVSDSNIGFFHNESNWNNNPKINLSQEKITTNDMTWLNSEFTTSQSYILTFDVICTKQDNNGILLFRNPSQSLNDSGYYIYSANSKTYVYDGETTSQMNSEYLNYGIHRVRIDCLNNSASVEIDGETIIDELNVSDLSNTIGLKASNGGNISISNIDLIEYECIFHDKCNSSSNLSNYGSAVFIAGDSSKNCKLTYNSSGQYYNFGPPSAGLNQSFIPINLLNNKSTSFKIIMKYYSGYNSIGFIAYTDTSNYCTFDYISQRNSLTCTNKINGSISANSIILGKQSYTTEIIPATIEIHVDVENMNMKCTGKWKNELKENTITGQIPSNVTKFGLYCYQASNATYGLGNIYDIKIIQV